MDYQKKHFLRIKAISDLIRIFISTINHGVKKAALLLKYKFPTQRIVLIKYQLDQWKDGKK